MHWKRESLSPGPVLMMLLIDKALLRMMTTIVYNVNKLDLLRYRSYLNQN